MKNKYLNKAGIENKYDKRQKIIDGISYFIGASGPVTAVGAYFLDSNISGELYGGLTIGTPILGGIVNKFGSRINARNKERALMESATASAIEGGLEGKASISGLTEKAMNSEN
jgi:hypothetical protein